MKCYVATVGFQDYALEEGDAVALLAISGRARRLSSDYKYGKPRQLASEGEPFVSSISLMDVIEREPADDELAAAPAPEVPF